MMQKTYQYVLLLLILNFTMPLSADTWKVFFYMDSTDDLNDMAIKNITDMVRGKPDDTVDFVVQLHAYYKAGLRYRVTSTGLVFLEETTLSGNCKQDFIDAATWAFASNTADHIMLIASDHGWGVLDPEWNEEAKEWQVGTDGLNNSCSIKRSQLDERQQHKNHKGFMFMVDPRAYLNNQDLTDVLSYIQNNLLGGKKIDIFAFDTCMGDMFELGYLIAPYAHYLVGNQSCSLKDGFEYQGIVKALNQGLPPREMAKSMVQVFDAYYARYDTSGIYTHAALDLSQLPQASKALDMLISKILQRSDCKLLCSKAAEISPRFCMWPMYTDLIAFCKCVQEQLANEPSSEVMVDLQAAFTAFYQAMKPVIVARCGGSTTQGLAYGVAIYLPTHSIDSSYYRTLFARDSLWIRLLQEIV